MTSWSSPYASATGEPQVPLSLQAEVCHQAGQASCSTARETPGGTLPDSLQWRTYCMQMYTDTSQVPEPQFGVLVSVLVWLSTDTCWLWEPSFRVLVSILVWLSTDTSQVPRASIWSSGKYSGMIVYRNLSTVRASILSSGKYSGEIVKWLDSSL